MDLNKRVIDMTLGELLSAIDEHTMRDEPKQTVEHSDGMVYGLLGIAKLFGVSKATAQRIKNSGRIDGAITQYGQTIVTDSRKALELMNQSK